MNLQSKYTFWSIIKLDWESSLDGELAGILRDILKRQRISGNLKELESFAHKYKEEIEVWHKDYINKFGHSHFELLTAINSKKTHRKSLVTPILASLLIILLMSSVYGLNSLRNLFKGASVRVDPQLAQVQTNDPLPQEKDVFENETEGYKFSYPKGWKAELREDKVVLEPENMSGKLLAYVVDDKLELDYEIDNREMKERAEKIGQEIKNSFELTEAKTIDEEYVKQRYLETLASGD